MNNRQGKDFDSYFWKMEERYRRYVLHRIKSYLDNSGYKGLAFLQMLASRDALHKVYQQTPLIQNIIYAFDYSLMNDRRTAVSEAVKAADRIKAEAREQQEKGTIVIDFTPKALSEEGYAFWRTTLQEQGREKVGYLPGPEGFLQAGERQDVFVTKLLLRYYTLKSLVKTFERAFTPEALKQEAEKSPYKDKTERENEAVESIGRRHFPELLGGSSLNTEAEYTEEQTETTPEETMQEEEHTVPDITVLGLEKHEWLGSQKELGELYIELKRKGWIKEIHPKTVAASYISGNTMEQVLKPGTGFLYRGVYSKRYKPKFEGIKVNIPKSK